MSPASAVVTTFYIFCLVCASYQEHNSRGHHQTENKNEDLLNSLDNNDEYHSVWTSIEEHACNSSGDLCSPQISDPAEMMIQGLYQSIKQAVSNLANPNHYPAHHNIQNSEEFDFIVVGAGSAGSVVANRLTEVAGWKVLLVEAGGDPTKSSELPRLSSALQSTEIDWQYQTDAGENNCLGTVNNRCNWPRGKVLGGSSTINYMMYVRGNAKDFDAWAAAGNTGWSYEDVLPYFKKSEDIRSAEVMSMEESEKYHGRGGYLKVESWLSAGEEPFMKPFIEAMEELGYPFNADCNGKNQTGFTKAQATLKDHRRCSAAKAFLSPIKDRKNLKVSKYSLTTKILIDKNSSRSYGVEFINKDGQTIQVRATKEVILSAGAINSPQLLMLSGIGPKHDLMDLGLPVIKDLPVGENLQDHPLLVGLVMTLHYDALPSEPHLQSIFDFLIKGSSNLSTILPIGYAGFINTVEGVEYPDIELLQAQFSKNDSRDMVLLLKSLNYKEEVINEFIKINENAYTVIFFCSMLRPFSRGRISLKNTDPKTHPNIVSGYFSDRRDIDTFLRTYEFISRLVETKGMKSVNAQLHEIHLSACDAHPTSSAEYRECSMRHLAGTTYHYSGSCKMGRAQDSGTVVDPSLRVLGVQGLRIADASIMPTIPSGNINAPTIMVGEKAADLIKSSWT